MKSFFCHFVYFFAWEGILVYTACAVLSEGSTTCLSKHVSSGLTYFPYHYGKRFKFTGSYFECSGRFLSSKGVMPKCLLTVLQKKEKFEKPR